MTIKNFFASPFKVMLTLIVLLFLVGFSVITYCVLTIKFTLVLLYLPLFAWFSMLFLPFIPFEYTLKFKTLPRGFWEAGKILLQIYRS